MERQEFLKSLGISFAAVCAGACLASCGKDDSVRIDEPSAPPAPVESTLPEGSFSAKFTDMPTVGKSVIVGKVLFIRIAIENVANSFVAVNKLCPHQGGDLVWKSTFFDCQKHGAGYKADGSIINQPKIGGGSTSPLRLYPLTVDTTKVIANTA